ncbi:MAG: hypothetical protein A3I05_06805 [Deltaproteobacteria bacterium RIFCSPLOWO2_02_FULL_44_10]|nr:MAG: hypothetical protein A3C46_06995 [Deltaproteobacteria bacterium RIFCSPHIGHO2_02_FULL_44_16]OGQ46732.1 MAG: hypothetical protein A3I05_06805 [Deltaproteobacteria bacterium RIFCSPLOWO2_02_FULL_44_10]
MNHVFRSQFKGKDKGLLILRQAQDEQKTTNKCLTLSGHRKDRRNLFGERPIERKPLIRR